MAREELLLQLEEAKQGITQLQAATAEYFKKYNQLQKLEKKKSTSVAGAVVGATAKTGAVGAGAATVATTMATHAIGADLLIAMIQAAGGGLGVAVFDIGLAAAACSPVGLAALGVGTVGLTAAGIHGSKKAHKKRVEKINDNKEFLEHELGPLVEKVKELAESPAMKRAQELLPEEYRNIKAIDFMYDRIKYGRSLTLQEAMDAYDIHRQTLKSKIFKRMSGR